MDYKTAYERVQRLISKPDDRHPYSALDLEHELQGLSTDDARRLEGVLKKQLRLLDRPYNTTVSEIYSLIRSDHVFGMSGMSDFDDECLAQIHLARTRAESHIKSVLDYLDNLTRTPLLEPAMD